MDYVSMNYVHFYDVLALGRAEKTYNVEDWFMF